MYWLSAMRAAGSQRRAEQEMEETGARLVARGAEVVPDSRGDEDQGHHPWFGQLDVVGHALAQRRARPRDCARSLVSTRLPLCDSNRVVDTAIQRARSSSLSAG